MTFKIFSKENFILKKIIISFVLIVTIIGSTCSTLPYADAEESPDTPTLVEEEDTKISYLLYETNCNQIITKQNADITVNASLLSRMMTCFIALENFSLTDSIIANESSKSYTGGYSIVKEKAYTVDTLVKAALIGNADNAARLLASQICAKKNITENDFIKTMNDRAASFNMKNTVFANADGSYNEFQLTTVYDTALFVANAVKNSRFSNIYCAPAVLVWDNIIISNPHDLVVEENNTTATVGGTIAAFDNNDLNNEYSSTFYLKNNTDKKEEDYSLIFVTSGAQQNTSIELTELALNDIKNNYKMSLLVTAGDKINTITTEIGEITLAAGKTTYCVAPVDQENFIKHTNYIYEEGYDPTKIKEQVKPGTVVGQVQYQLNDGTTIQVPLVTVSTQEISHSRVDTIYDILSNNGKYKELFILIILLVIIELIVIIYNIYWFIVKKKNNKT